MPVQVFNPLKFTCAPNEGTPDYVIYHDFHRFVAYGLIECWPSADADDPNTDCGMARPVTREDVQEIRDYFLDLIETVTVSIWKGDYKPGDGSIDGDFHSVNIGNSDENPGEEETRLTWYPRLDNDAIMLELCVTGSDGTAIWLSYDALNDRKNVLAVLTEARKTIEGMGDSGTVWEDLVKLVDQEPVVS